MTGKNVKDRMGPGGMDADRIREIMGEASFFVSETIVFNI